MYKIAILDDEPKDIEILKDYLKKRAEEKNIDMVIDEFTSPKNFLFVYRKYDIVFFDIDMPEMNGIDAASYLRRIDKEVVIVFTTYLAQFAIKGYDVMATDFLLKPLNEKLLFDRLEKVFNICDLKKKNEITFVYKNEFVRLDVNEIEYIEIFGHTIVYVTASQKYERYGTLGALQKDSVLSNFLKCNNSCLINPHYIQSIKGNSILMKNGSEMQISRSRKKEFMATLAEWFKFNG